MGLHHLELWVIKLSSRATVFTALNIHLLCTETFMRRVWCQQSERKMKMLVAGKHFNSFGLSIRVNLWDFYFFACFIIHQVKIASLNAHKNNSTALLNKNLLVDALTAPSGSKNHLSSLPFKIYSSF